MGGRGSQAWSPGRQEDMPGLGGGFVSSIGAVLHPQVAPPFMPPSPPPHRCSRPRSNTGTSSCPRSTRRRAPWRLRWSSASPPRRCALGGSDLRIHDLDPLGSDLRIQAVDPVWGGLVYGSREGIDPPGGRTHLPSDHSPRWSVLSKVRSIDLFLPPPLQSGSAPAPPKRKQLYAGILSKLRQLMICRMAKPEEARGV